jgi:hypothetical protein
MTTTAQRDADEALGRVSRQLEAQADRLDLAISKRRLFGEWTIEAISMSRTLKLRETGATEIEAVDKVLDRLNHVDVAVV